MKITDKKVVSLIYELEVEGQLADKTTEERPLEFIQGTGNLLPLFEKNIEGKEEGDKFAFTLAPADGYGEWEEGRVLELPKEAFEVDGQIREDLLVEGQLIPMMNSAGGIIPGKVMEVSENKVKMDLNHPMAGKTLNFSGKILSVRDASQKELDEGLHGELAGGCGCGHCGGEGHGDGCGHGHCEGEGHGDGCGHGHCGGEGHGDHKGKCCKDKK